MFHKIRNCCKRKDIAMNHRNYEQDILSSLQDVLPNYFKRCKNILIQDQKDEVQLKIDDLVKSSGSSSREQQSIANNSDSQNSDDEKDHSGPYCKMSLDYFHINNKFRQSCIYLYESKSFQYLHLIYVVIHCVILYLKPYNGIENGTYLYVSTTTASVFNYIGDAFYVIYEIVAVVSLGIWNSKNSYYRSAVNLINLIGLFFGVVLLQFYFYIFRIFYIVGLVSKLKLFSAVGKISTTLQQSASSIFYLIFIIAFCLYLYSIVGLQIWNGKMNFYCQKDGVLDSSSAFQCGTNVGRRCPEGYQCLRGKFEQPISQFYQDYTTFESVQQSMQSVFLIHNMDGFSVVEQKLADSYDHFISTVFIWSYEIICVLFLQNIIVAVYLKYYQQISQKLEEANKSKTPQILSNKQLSDRKQSIYVMTSNFESSRDRVKLLLNYKQDKSKKKNSKYFKVASFIGNSTIIKYTYYIIFLCNLILMSLQNKYQTDNLQIAIARCNLIFVFLYLVEDFTKLYLWRNKDNKITLLIEISFDLICFIVQCTQIDKPFILSSIKGLRLLWIFDSQTDWANYTVLLHALLKQMRIIPEKLLITGCFVIIITVFGRNFFAGKFRFNEYGQYDSTALTETRFNFDGLRESIVCVFSMLCQDSWQYIFYSSLKFDSQIPYPFFIITMLTIKFIILPLFLTLTLDNYEQAKREAEKQKTMAGDILKEFKLIRMPERSQVFPAVPPILVNTPMERKNKGNPTQIINQSSEESDFNDRNDNTISHQKAIQRSGSRVVDKKGNYEDLRNQIPSNLFECLQGSSLFLLHQKTQLRRKLIHISNWKYYDTFFTVLILLENVLLGFDSPMRPPDQDFLFRSLNITITVFFIIDVLLKSLAYGFFYNQQDKSKAYIKNRWNIIDFSLLILTSIYDFGIYESRYLNALKPIRFLRILISMRKGQQNEQINLIASSLFETISLLSSMLFVSGIFIWILSIFCMYLWKGELTFCTGLEPLILDQVSNQQECLDLGGKWKNSTANFDNILNSLVSLFKIIIGESWAQLLFEVSDITTPDQVPKENASSHNQYFFFFLLFMLNILLYNLFVGLIINNYRTIKENLENYKSLNAVQREWLQMIFIMQKKELITLVSVPSNSIRRFCYNLTSYHYFDLVVIIVQIINLVICSLHDETLGISTQNGFKSISIIIIIIFHAELIMKLCAFWSLFFKDDHNKIDLVLLIITDILFGVQDSLHATYFYMIPLIFRSLKIVHLEKFIKLNKNLKILFDVVRQVLPTLLSVVALVLLTTCVYALMGEQVFAKVQVSLDEDEYPYFQENALDSSLTFHNFEESFYILIQITIGQSWPTYLDQYATQREGCYDQTYEQVQLEGKKGCGSYFSYFFFLSFIILIKIIMESLFLAMVIESYSESITENSAVINPYQIDDYLLKWSDYDPQGSGWVSVNDFAFLMFELNSPLGFKDEKQNYLEFNSAQKYQNKAHILNHKKKLILYKKDIFQKLNKFNIPVYKNDKIHFKDVCIQIAYNALKAKYKEIDPIEDKIVNRKIRKSWENKYPELQEFAFERKQQIQYAVDVFAISSIKKILLEVIMNKKAKKRMLDEKLQNKIKQLEINEVNYLTKQNIEDPKSNRRKSHIKKKIYNFASSFNKKSRQQQDLDGLSGAGGTQTHIRGGRKNTFKTHTIINSSSKFQQRKSSLETHNFYIDPQEMHNGFPMKVTVETQKLDFPETSIQQSQIQQPLFTKKDYHDSDHIRITSNQDLPQVRLRNGISEKDSSEEDDNQDSVILQTEKDI